MKMLKWAQVLAFCTAVSLGLSGCGSDSSGVAATPLSTEADALVAVGVTDDNSDPFVTFENGIPQLPAEISLSFGFLAPKAIKKDAATRAAELKALAAKAPTVDPIAECTTGSGTYAYETFADGSYTELYTFDLCEIPFTGNNAGASCVLNGTVSMAETLLSATADYENWRHTEKFGTGNGVADLNDVVIVCTDGLDVVTFTQDNNYTDNWRDFLVEVNSGTQPGSVSEVGAYTVVNGNMEGAATWSTSGSGTYSWKYIVDTSYTENGKESWTGKASFLIDPDVTAVGVEMDFSGSYTGSATYKYYIDPDEEWETMVEKDTLSITRNDGGCGDGVYVKNTNTKYDFYTSDLTGTGNINGDLAVTFLPAGDGVILTLNGEVIPGVTTEAELDAWSATSTCSL